MPPKPDLDGSSLTLALVVARFNEDVTSRLLDGALEAIKRHNVRGHEVFSVPGSFELPVVAKQLAESGRYDAVVCLGAVIRHETDHYLHIATQAAAGIQRVAVDRACPASSVSSPATASSKRSRAQAASAGTKASRPSSRRSRRRNCFSLYARNQNKSGVKPALTPLGPPARLLAPTSDRCSRS